jgi:hypothetical protein
MVFVKGGLDKDFVMPVKDNRKVALTLPDMIIPGSLTHRFR